MASRKKTRPKSAKKTDTAPRTPAGAGQGYFLNDFLNYEYLFIKKDRAIKIIKEMSEFLRILDLRESEILKTMIVRFAIESVEASQGSLIVYDVRQGVLKYQDTYVYDANNKIILDTSVFEGYSDLLDISIKPGEGVAGESYQKGGPILVENIDNSPYQKPAVGDVMKIEIGSVIAMPLKINNDVTAVLEITNARSKAAFSKEDLETIMIIANFASTILENARLYLWAIHDSLTGLYNNHYFSKEFADLIDKSKRYGRVFSLVMFDVDDFKKINDTYGHHSGDKALTYLAESIRRTIRRDVDIASRYGGDEFMIVFPGTNAENSLKVCERLLQLVRSKKIDASDGRSFSFTLSMGISEYPRDGEESFFLQENADKALYDAKNAGKNRISVYSRSMNGH